MTMELLTSPTPNGWKVTIMVEELREAGFELADLTVEHRKFKLPFRRVR